MASLFDGPFWVTGLHECLKTIGFYAHLQAVEIITDETRIEVYVRHRPTKYLVFPRPLGRSCMQSAHGCPGPRTLEYSTYEC